MNPQPSILPGVPRVARYLSFNLPTDVTSEDSRQPVETLDIDENITVGLGAPLVAYWNGELVNRSIAIAESLAGAYRLEKVVDGFKFGDAELGRDLTGHEDGTENPVDDDAVAAAFVPEGEQGMAGSCFLAVQRKQETIIDKRTPCAGQVCGLPMFILSLANQLATCDFGVGLCRVRIHPSDSGSTLPE